MSNPTGTLRSGSSLTRKRILVAISVVLAVTAAQYLYGNRHDFFDLKIYYSAIHWWAHGHRLYTYTQPDRVQASLGFTYPPFAAVLMYPMIWLPLKLVIVLVWLGSGVCVVVTSAWLLGPIAARHGWPGWYLFFIVVPLITTLEPIRENTAFGQINMFLAILILWDLLFALPRGAPFSGVGVGLATAIKLTPGIFILYLLVTRRFRAAGVATGTALGTTLLAAILAPRDSWQYWEQTLWKTQRIGHLYLNQNQSIMGMISRIARPDQPGSLLWLLVVLVIGGYGLWRAGRAASAGDQLTALTLTGLAGSLVSPVSWQHHLYWFVPALIVLLDVAATPGVARRRWYAWAGGVIWFTVTFSVIELFDWHVIPMRFLDTPEGFVLSNWYVLLMVGLLVALPIRLLRPGEPSATRLATTFRTNL
ncbi:alpha-(1-2)-phosphatidylinositol mannoside mannosyltransferase [Rugosimonospora acidiphila]|uniref:Alpha-(1-2)-phosphatidylinositol mannoside mannosyltransferase n=1 Tax=Rugosimonospora acidiphila TaxID=556531 RepID=A0ABP9RR04_9ACTN